MRIFLLFLFFTTLSSAQIKKWVNFNKDNSGLPTNSIDFIIQDKNYNYWIGTYDAGLVFYNGNNWIVYNSSNSPLPYNSVRTIAVDSFNTVWIGTYGGGLAEFDSNNWKNL